MTSSPSPPPRPEGSTIRVLGPSGIEELAQARISAVEPTADLSAMAVVFNLIRASDRVTQRLETVHRPMGWSWAGFRILFWVWLLGPLEQREIACLASASRASISSAINTLHRDGFVERQPQLKPGDRRLVRVALTTSGHALIAKAFTAHNQLEQQLVSIYTKQEQATLVGLLRRLLNHLDTPDQTR